MVLRAVAAAAFVFVLACSMVSVAQGPPSPQGPPGPPGPPGGGSAGPDEESREQTTDLVCEMSCGADKLPTPTVELRWDPAKDKRTERRSEQRLETTVYKKGFAQNELAAVPLTTSPTPAAPNTRFARPDRTPGKKLPPSLELKVTKSELTRAPKAKALLRAEGLEPGLTYFWRLSSRVGNTWITSQTVRCQAPVCPIDSGLRPSSP